MPQRFVERYGSVAAPPLSGVPVPHDVEACFVEALFDVGVAGMKPELLAEIASHAEDMKQVSPHGHLGGLRANVYLLHGEGDTVIPATETQWLAREVPPGRLRSALVSPAIEHVDLKNPSLGDKWALVHFMGRVLAEADEGGSR